MTKQVLKPHPKVVKSRSWMDVTQRLLGGETKENANVTTSRDGAANTAVFKGRVVVVVRRLFIFYASSVSRLERPDPMQWL